MINSRKLEYIDSLFLLNKASLLVAGLQKAVLIYYDPFEQKISGAISESAKSNLQEINIEEAYDLSIIMQDRKRKSEPAWLSEPELPFQLKKDKHIQREVFDELENVVLMMKFRNKDDGQYDLLYLFINANTTNFGLSRPEDLLKTEHKSIISQLISNSFTLLIAQRNQFREKEDRLKEHYRLLQQKLEHLQKEYKQDHHDSARQLIDFCNGIIAAQENEFQVHFEMSRDVLELLSNYKGSIPALETQLRTAVQRAYDTNPDPLSPVLRLEEWHFDNLHQTIYDEKASVERELLPDSRYLGTYALLNRLEDAARRLVSNREKMTGANVGKAMDKPISAAAISDALKKHGPKIKSLCKQYPDRWQIVRKEFRPLMNVLQA